MNPVSWLILIIVLLIIEIITLGLTTIWFAGGALAGFVLCILGAGWQIQAVAFLAVSFLLLVFTRPWAVKYLNSKTVKTNVDSLAGKTAMVTETIDNEKQTGCILIGGQPWTARSADDHEVIPVDTVVGVEKSVGVKALVRIKKEEK